MASIFGIVLPASILLLLRHPPPWMPFFWVSFLKISSGKEERLPEMEAVFVGALADLNRGPKDYEIADNTL